MKRFEFLRFLSAAMIAVALWAVAHAHPPQSGGSAVDYLLVSDYDTNSVKRYDAATGAFVDTFVPKHSGGLNQPQGLVFGPHDHNLYVASGELSGSAQRKAVLRYDGTTGAFIDDFAERGHLDVPHAVIFGPDGNLYVADGLGSNGKVVRYNGTTGAFMDDFVPNNSGGLARPFALVFGPSGPGPGNLDLYVVSRLTDSVKRYDGSTGAYLGDFVASGSGGLSEALGLTFGPDGNVYVATGSFFRTNSSAVFRFQGPSGTTPGAPMPSAGNDGAIFVPSGSGELLTTFGLIFGPDGNGDGQQDLYLPSFETAGSNRAKQKTATIKRYDGMTGAFIDTFVTANSGGLDQPNYLTFTNTDPVTLQYLGVSAPSMAAYSVPEPTYLLLVGLGVAVAALGSRRRAEKPHCALQASYERLTTVVTPGSKKMAATGALILCLGSQASAHDFIIDQSHHHDPNNYRTTNIHGLNPFGQEFTPTFPSLDMVELRAFPASGLYVNIREGTITGPLLGTKAPGVEGGFGAHFDFPAPIALLPGDLYVIEVVPFACSPFFGSFVCGVTDDSGFQRRDEDYYHRGRMIYDGTPVEGTPFNYLTDLTFRTGSTVIPEPASAVMLVLGAR